MLSGFNTNVRYRGVVFHVQTEDSGRAHPHVITHLYHGGTILASEKTAYREHLDSVDLARHVKELMEDQHRAMLERLRSGELDGLVEERLGPGVFADRTRPAGPGRPPGASAPPPAAPEPAASPRGSSGERPLDELILDYLVESARHRKRRTQ